MDIRGWPMDRIMQLPDCCFGRRYPVCVSALSVTDVPAWDISEIALPERCVIWELVMWVSNAAVVIDRIRLALGDHLPTTTAGMDAFEPLFPGLGQQGAEPRVIATVQYPAVSISRLRLPVFAAGRRPVLEVISAAPAESWMQVVIVVSSIPTEVPDWLCSGNLRSP